VNTHTATDVEHQLGELGSAVAKDRASMLLSLCEVPPTDPAVIAACERLLEDTTLTVIGIPYRFGEIRAVAADTVWAIRASQGIDQVVNVPDALVLCSTNDVLRLAREAGVSDEGNGVEGTLRTFEKLVAANKVPRRDIRLETIASKL
jgi:hypothetical protein